MFLHPTYCVCVSPPRVREFQYIVIQYILLHYKNVLTPYLLQQQQQPPQPPAMGAPPQQVKLLNSQH